MTKKKISVLTTLLTALTIVLLFIPGFFQYSYSLTSYSTSSGISRGSFVDLLDSAADGMVIIAILIACSMIAVIAIIWSRYRKQKKDATTALICTGGALALLLVGAFIGKDNYSYSFSSPIPSMGINVSYRYTFISFGFLFFGEILLLVVIGALCLLYSRCIDERSDVADAKIPVDNVVAELTSLKELMDKGIISQEEFNERKKSIMRL